MSCSVRACCGRRAADPFQFHQSWDNKVLLHSPGHLVPTEVHEKRFVGSQRAFKKPSQPAVARYNKRHTPEEVTEMTGRLLRKESKLRKRLAEKGIDYDFPGFVSFTCDSLVQ